jgi:hypothetical protein
VLELAKVVAHGHTKDEAPGLRDVAGDPEWMVGRPTGELRGRSASEPEDAVRLGASQAAFWKGTWVVEVVRSPVAVAKVSTWKGAPRFPSGGRQVAESGSAGGWPARATVSTEGSVPQRRPGFLRRMEPVPRRRSNAALGAPVIGGSS